MRRVLITVPLSIIVFRNRDPRAARLISAIIAALLLVELITVLPSPARGSQSAIIAFAIGLTPP
jgi:hypothetical protein